MLVSRAYELIGLASVRKDIDEEPMWMLMQALGVAETDGQVVLQPGTELCQAFEQLEHDLSH